MKIFSNITKAIAFLKKDWHVAFSYKLQFFSSAFSVFISTLVFFFLSDFVGHKVSQSITEYGGAYFAFVIVGITLIDYMVVSAEAFAKSIREGQTNGTFEALLVTPTSIMTILFASYIYPFLFTTFRVLVYIIVGVFFCGVQFHISSIFLCFLSFFITLLPFYGLGLLSAAFIIVYKQASPINWALGASSTLLGGVFYPVSSLPAWLEPLAWAMPVTYGIDLMRKVLLANGTVIDVQRDLIVLLIFSIFFISAGVIAVKRSLKLARNQGTLLHY